MPIAALPPSTARAIGSTLVIADACSVVKELLDNALDAAASSILVEISKNTVDVIQVRDNGHGISPDDYPQVCKRNFTSKIRTLEDLRDLGGRCLGFRGEALASACEMVGSLSISTKTETQAVGSKLTYSRTGDLVRQVNRTIVIVVIIESNGEPPALSEFPILSGLRFGLQTSLNMSLFENK